MAIDLPIPENLSETTPRRGHTGYVALLGRPNTGKSTFLNTLLGCHIAAVSNKPQTTRKAFLGIYNADDAQIIFLDAPGVHPGKIAIDEAMSNSVSKVMEDADIVLCLIDPTRAPGEEDQMAAKIAAESAKPVLMVINKCDIATKEQQASSEAFYRDFLPAAEVIHTTATQPESVKALAAKVASMLPVDIFLYENDDITTAYERDIAAELIREALLERLKDEVPHCIAVTVDTWKDDGRSLVIESTLTLEREAHKGIVIGQGGRMIKAIRHDALEKLKAFCEERRIELHLFLKVIPNWRKHKQFLKDIKLLDD